MYTERFSLSFVSGVLLGAAERRRPGLGAWNDRVRATLRQLFEAELAGIRPRFLELFDDPASWEKLERIVLGECFERYCAVAERQTSLEQKEYGVWRGGDLVARGAFAAGGLAFGLFMVYAPFIPVPRTWDFFILASMLGAPFVPDLQVLIHRRRYEKALDAIVMDMKAAQAAQSMYAPLGLPGTKALEADGPEVVDLEPRSRSERGRERV